MKLGEREIMQTGNEYYYKYLKLWKFFQHFLDFPVFCTRLSFVLVYHYAADILISKVSVCMHRLFDSQNNNRGGYNVGKLYYYEGSVLSIEW